jgi:hypothetical protein
MTAQRWTRAAGWIGAGAGFAAGVALSRTVSMAAKPGQLPGIAASLGFDPRGYLWRLVILVVCPIFGGFLATRLAGGAPPQDGPEIPRRRLTLLRSLMVAVLLPGSVTVLSAAAQMRSWSIADLFENGHALLPASEYLRGELPYRDVIPGHGLVADGLLQAAGLKVFGDDYRGLHRTEMLVGAFFWPSLYALAYVATGGPAAAFGALLLSNLSFPQYFFLRVLPSFWILTVAILASRRGDRRLWFACGALIPLALLVAVEFAAYAAGAALVAVWVSRGPRWKQLASFVAGGVTSAALIALAFAALGVLREFLRTTFLYLPTLMPAYGIPLVRPRLPSLSLGGLIAFLADPTAFLYAFVAVAILALGAVLPRGAGVNDRARAALPILAWVVFAMVSVVERRHVRYPMFLVPLGLVLLALWVRGARWRSPRGLAAAAGLLLVVVLWHPWGFVRGLAASLENPREPPGLATFDRPRRARGALFPPADASLVRATSSLIEQARLAPDDTWLDFANAPGLHYLFDRDCPIRYYEVPFYESPAAQAEVIAAVASNPRVRAVLVRSGLPSDPIDGVPNAARAPRVAKYLELNFEPFLKQEGVEFWLRREASSRKAPG